MFCGECGTKNETGSNFCENCGAKLENKKKNPMFSNMSKQNKTVLKVKKGRNAKSIGTIMQSQI